MKNCLTALILCLLLSFSCDTRGQGTAASYNFSSFARPYASVASAGAGVHIAATGVRTGVPIGFTFRFCGVDYTTVSAGSNGYISLANSGAPSSYDNYSPSMMGTPGWLMPFWGNVLDGTTYYSTTGYPGSRVFTFEFNTWRNTVYNVANFQVKLYEGTNAVEFCYGYGEYYSGNWAIIGIGNNDMDFSVMDSSFAPTDIYWGSYHDTLPPDGSVLRWQPPCPVVATATNDGPLCLGGTVHLTAATTAATYSWVGPDGFTSTSLSNTIAGVTGSKLGTYIFRATNGTCSTHIYTNVITVPKEDPGIIVSANTALQPGQTLTMSNAIGGGVWGASNANATITAAGVVTGVTKGSCVVSYTKTNSCGIDSTATKNISIYKTSCPGWDFTGTPGFSTNIVTGSSKAIDMVIDGADVPYAGYTEQTTGRVMIKKYVAGTWVDVGSPISASTIIQQMAMAIGPGNVPYVAYATYPNHKATVVKYNGSSWVNVGPPEFSASSAIALTIRISRTGIPYVAYRDVAYGYRSTVMKFDGSNWIPIGGAGFSPTGVLNVSLAIDTSNTPWVSTHTESGNIFVRKYNGTSWDSVAGIATGLDGLALGTGFEFDSNNTLYAGFTSPWPNYRPVVKKFSGGSWTTVGSPEFSTAKVESFVLKLNSTGTPYAAFTNMNNSNQVTVMKYDGANWVPVGDTAFLPSSTMYYVPFTINTAGVPHVGFIDVGYGYRLSVMRLRSAPGANSGASALCTGASATYTNPTGGGTWSSSNPSIATAGPGTGIVTGMAPGTCIISYTTADCSATSVLTVNPLPDAGTISGSSSVMPGNTITLTNATTGGAWSSSSGNASVSASGVVTGIAVGVAVISYTRTNACGTSVATKTITINALSGSLGPASMCIGSTALFTNSLGGGTWYSTNAAVAAIGASSGTVTAYAAGTTTISYTAGGSAVTSVLTVIAAPSVSGTLKACTGTTTALTASAGGGAWSSGNTAVATVGAGTGIALGITPGTAVITYSVASGCFKTVVLTVNSSPAIISGNMNICTGATSVLANATSGGLSWTSSNTSVATISATSGIVNGIAPGTATISYTLANNCYATAVVTINALPPAIGGTLNACAGATSSLSNAATGGTWSSSNAAIAVAGTGTGVVSGMATGTATISYTLGPSCVRTAVFTVKTAPAPIAGTPVACTGTTTTLTNMGGGAWSSGNAAVATVLPGAGIVTGVSPGTAAVTYTLANSCTAVAVVTVNAAPPASTGASTVCVGASATLSNTLPGGTWISANSSYATVGAATGVVTGIGAGTTTISYTFGGACLTKKVITINAIPGSITGTPAVCPGAATTLVNASGPGTWSSSNTAVGTIGTISAVAGRFAGISPGMAIVSYTFSNGCPRMITVTVNATANAGSISSSGGFIINTVSPPTSVTLSSTGDAGGTWSSSNTARAVINGATGVATAVAAGTTTISYSVILGSCSATATHTLTVLSARPGNGEHINPNGENIIVYPNPATDLLFVEGLIGASAANTLHLELKDITGQVVWMQERPYEQGYIKESLHLPSSLARGVYLFTLSSGSEQLTVRLVLQ